MNDENIMSEMEILFLALADKTRLRLLNLLRNGEVCVGALCEVTKISQPNVSRHLAYLKNAGIVTTRRDGKRIHYFIEKPTSSFAKKLLQNTLDQLELQKDMQTDYEKLIDICRLREPSYSLSNSESNTFADVNVSDRAKEELEIFLL